MNKQEKVSIEHALSVLRDRHSTWQFWGRQGMSKKWLERNLEMDKALADTIFCLEQLIASDDDDGEDYDKPETDECPRYRENMAETSGDELTKLDYMKRYDMEDDR